MKETNTTARSTGDGQEPDAGASARQSTMPEIGTYKDFILMSRKSYSTVSRWVCRRKLKTGVYIGHGMFNLSRVREYLDKDGTFLKVMR